MKLRNLLPALLLAAAAGCDSPLSTEPGAQIPADRQIVDAATARASLVGAYDALQDLSYYGRNLYVLGDLAADNADHQGSYQYLGDVDRNKAFADNTAITNVWSAIYTGIARDNVIIAKVPTVPGLSDEERNEILGEAYFLRALSYHNLVKFWGGVPLSLTPVTDPQEASTFTRATEAQVYSQILADLDKAAELITEESQTTKASTVAVDALRARVLLYTGDWQGALDAADRVLEAKGDALTVPFDQLFVNESTDEDIFRVSFTPVEYNEIGYYYLWDGRWEVAPTEDLYESYEPGDLRLDVTVGEDDGDFEGRKYPTTVGGEDVHVLRLAEVVLIKAEALARLDRLDEAVDEYNKVRVRAGLAPHVLGVDVTTQDEVLAAIWHERRVELAIEGDRFPDLVRTGQAESVLDITANQTLLPIPAREITAAPGIVQNPGY